MTMDRVSHAFPPPDADTPGTAPGTEVTDALTGLIEACQDARSGYERAAEQVDSETYRNAFQMYAAQRAQFAGELIDAGLSFGVDWDGDGTIEGGLRRAWLRLKALFTGGDPEEVTEAIIGIEEETVEAYEDALERNLPPQVEAVVRRQYNVVVGAVRHLRELEEQAD